MGRVAGLAVSGTAATAGMRGRLRKATSLAAVLRRSPREFVDRVIAIAEGRAESLRARPGVPTPLPWPTAVERLTSVLGAAFGAALSEPGLARVEEEVTGRLAALAPDAPYTLEHNADARLARCCFAVCRALRPAVVVETGVGYGVTTAFILAALEENGEGVLHSIDLPPLDRGAERAAGALVPERLRIRWRLHRGMSRRVLPGVLERVATVDVFLHDSMHTYDNMRFELDAALDSLAAGGVVLADDIEGNGAFAELQRAAPRELLVCEQMDKPALFGVMVR